MSTSTETRATLLKRLREQHQASVSTTQALLKELQAVRKEIRQAMQAGPKTVPEIAAATNLPADQVPRPVGGLYVRVAGRAADHAEAVRAQLQRAMPGAAYVTVTPTFSICPVHGYLAGEHEFCPVCDDERLAAKRAALAA